MRKRQGHQRARILFVAFLALALWEVSRCAWTSRDRPPPSEEDADSAASNKTEGSSVWPIGYLLEHGAKRSHCTATLVGPRTILTALHCLSEEPTAFVLPGKGAADLFTDSLQPIADSGAPGVVGNGYDLALVELTIALGADYPTMSPAPTLAPSAIAWSIGFGGRTSAARRFEGTVAALDGRYLINQYKSFEAFQATASEYSPVLPSRRYFEYELRAPLEGYIKFADEAHPCHGDSGGPVIAVVDGVERLVGVISGVLFGDEETRCGGGTVFTRIPPNISDVSLKPK